MTDAWDLKRVFTQARDDTEADPTLRSLIIKKVSAQIAQTKKLSASEDVFSIVVDALLKTCDPTFLSAKMPVCSFTAQVKKPVLSLGNQR